MNILIVNHDFSLFRFRPDSTLIRSQGRYYMPDFVTALSFAPIVYFRCSRPGKSVEEKFADRYVGSFGYGILLYPELSGRITGDREFIASALDYTSLIPNQIHPISDYGAFPAFKPLCITVNGHTVCEKPQHPSYDKIRWMISGITRYSATRTGDFIAYELSGKIAVKVEDQINLRTGDELLASLLIL